MKPVFICQYVGVEEEWIIKDENITGRATGCGFQIRATTLPDQLN